MAFKQTLVSLFCGIQAGFPGDLDVSVTYKIVGDYDLKVLMRAKALNKATPVNLAQHTYWNLGGHNSGDILSNTLQLFASRYTPVDKSLIPTGKILPVKGTPFDFLDAHTIGHNIGQLAGGYDINYALDPQGLSGKLKKVAYLKDSKSGRALELWANAPGVQLYTSNSLTAVGKGGFEYKPHAAVCLETQGFPDSVNHPNFPSQIVKPGKTYKHDMLVLLEISLSLSTAGTTIHNFGFGSGRCVFLTFDSLKSLNFLEIVIEDYLLFRLTIRFPLPFNPFRTMNFLMRTAHPAVPEQPTVQELPSDAHLQSKPGTTLEGLIAEDSFPRSSSEGGRDGDCNGSRGSNGMASTTEKNYIPVGNHADVAEDEGWITIPYSTLGSMMTFLVLMAVTLPNNPTIRSLMDFIVLYPEKDYCFVGFYNLMMHMQRSSLKIGVMLKTYCHFATWIVPSFFLVSQTILSDLVLLSVLKFDLESWLEVLVLLCITDVFLISGEQLHILACLSASKQDTEIINPFRIAAVLSKNGKLEHGGKQANEIVGTESESVAERGDLTKQANEIVGAEPESVAERGDLTDMDHGPAHQNAEDNGETVLATDTANTNQDISVSESFLRMEDYKQQTESLLQRFRNSHFFVRVAESGEPLWSKRNSSELSSPNLETMGEKNSTGDAGKRATSGKDSHAATIIDRGNFDAHASGGIARNTVRCCALCNGDIVIRCYAARTVVFFSIDDSLFLGSMKGLQVKYIMHIITGKERDFFCLDRATDAVWDLDNQKNVLLQVNVCSSSMKDPLLEVLQFEKYEPGNRASENHSAVDSQYGDPYGGLLKWLLPLDHVLPPPARPLSPPSLNSSSGVGGLSHRYTLSSSSGSQLFSFGHLRSYSMSSLPPNNAPQTSAASSSPAKPAFELEDWDRFSSQNPIRGQESGNETLLSFRGVSLEPERFSVHCGLQGIYIPGKRWRRKLEIVQPVEIHSFAADCNTEDLLCVQIKNVSPAHIPDLVVFLDAVSIVFEKAPKGGPPLSLPIACIEAGNDYSLPNLVLRRGEEHSFILKPATSMWKDLKAHSENSLPRTSQSGSTASNLHPIRRRIGEGKRFPTDADQYAVLVSCRCNYTESRLFFKQPTTWSPRAPRDLMISVASEISEQTFGPSGVSQLPVQASNLTPEDLTLTVLAPASFTSPPSVVSLNSAPSTPMSPFVGPTEFTARLNGERRVNGVQKLSSMPIARENQKELADAAGRSVSLNEQTISSDSTAIVKLELMPLTDGVITLDTLQIAVKEKGLTYIPEHSLKVYAATSLATGIIDGVIPELSHCCFCGGDGLLNPSYMGCKFKSSFSG
ncbi:hypothetical protein ACLOJK_013094 [Asimina triloba]